jgi:hypothetical protein
VRQKRSHGRRSRTGSTYRRNRRPP